MAAADGITAAIRFGYGPTGGGDSDDAASLRARLDRPDPVELRLRGPGLAERLEAIETLRQARMDVRRNGADAQAVNTARRRLEAIATEDLRHFVLRPLLAKAGLRERLVAFWADHFTVEAKNRAIGVLAWDMIETAIRPHVAGRFGDMLAAVTTHPAMLLYLDQPGSIGPNSPAGQKRERGLNENLAREILELHTLGVGAAYAQADVRQFAELLTGMSVNRDGFVYRPRLAEPGAETVLGQRYGGRRGRVEDVMAALADLAARPETAAHIARKLAVHFVAPEPDPGLVTTLRDAFADTGGDLAAVTGALLDHPAARLPPGAKARTPHEFLVACLRALDVREARIAGLGRRELRSWIVAPLTAMGQRPQAPGGPNGWPEEPEAWITPAALTARIEFARRAARRLGRRQDPREVLDAVLGPLAPRELRFAVGAAETKEEGLAVLLASPAFNRR